MAYWKSPGICLRVIDYGETSQIAAFFTRERGRISAIAKGAKRKGSRFAGALEPLQLCEVVCFRGREGGGLHTLSELDVLDTYRGVRQDLRRLHAAAYVIELLRAALPEDAPQPEVFDLATGTLSRISALEVELDPAVVVQFEARLLELLGLFPKVDACVECGGALSTGRVAFSARLGGALCSSCRDGRDRTAREVPHGTLQALEVLGRSPDRAARLRIAPAQRSELRRLMNEYLAAALERELRLAKFIE